jgi:hypothetical protein
MCGRPAEADAKPFCSRRCADLDLQRWLSGRYAIPAAEDESEADRDSVPFADED